MALLIPTLIEHATTLATVVRADNPTPPSGGPTNPFDKVSFNLGFLGPVFTSYWQWWLGGVWAAVVLVCVFFFAVSLVSLRHIKAEHNMQKQSKAKANVLGTSISLGASVLVPLLVGVVIFVANAGH